jgi:hypothetical protein
MHVGTHPTRHLAHICCLRQTSILSRRAWLSPDLHASLHGSDYILVVLVDFRRIVSEDSRPCGRAFPADCLQPSHCQSLRTSVAFSDFPAFSQIWLRQISYLKRVRVTPGVYRPLARLNPSFRYLHWPGFIKRTHPFGLALYCVFSKQSRPPCYCNLRTLFYITNAGTPSS